MSTKTGDLFLILDIASRTEQGVASNVISFLIMSQDSSD